MTNRPIKTHDCASTLGMALLAAATMFGCASRNSPFEDWINARDNELWKGAASNLFSTAPAHEITGVQPSSSDDLAGADLSMYVRMALERNPAVRAADQRIASLAQRIPQAQSLNDPMLEVAPIGQMAETAAGGVGVMTGVSQRFPLGGKLSTAGRVAEAEVAAAIARRDEIRNQIAADVQQSYWRFYAAARALEVISENRSALEQFAQVADAQYRSGQSSQQDVLRATVELSELDSQSIALQQQADAARSMLNQLMNRPIDGGLMLPPRIEISSLALHLDDLIAAAAKRNPALQQMVAEIDADRQRMRLARLERVPDLTVSFGYNVVSDSGLSSVANGDDQWWLGFGINLPIWKDRLDAGEREANLNVLRGLSALATEQNAVAFRIQDGVLSAEAAHRRALLFRDVIIPQARQAVDASLSGYRAGAVDFLTLTSNWRRVLEFELMLHENVAESQQALAAIEQAIGAPLSSASADQETSNPVLSEEEHSINVGL